MAVISLVAGSVFLAVASNAAAENPRHQPYVSFAECKAHFEELKEEQINKLNKRKQRMGVGMPGVIYVRKKRDIRSAYESNLETCESLKTAEI